jgi:hypothetical protein
MHFNYINQSTCFLLCTMFKQNAFWISDNLYRLPLRFTISRRCWTFHNIVSNSVFRGLICLKKYFNNNNKQTNVNMTHHEFSQQFSTILIRVTSLSSMKTWLVVCTWYLISTLLSKITSDDYKYYLS